MSGSTSTEGSSFLDGSDLAYYYQAGIGPTALAKMFGIDRSTVYRRLLKEGVIDPERKSVPPRIEKCKHGHDMSVWGVQRYAKTGAMAGRYCRMCKRLRERVNHGDGGGSAALRDSAR